MADRVLTVLAITHVIAWRDSLDTTVKLVRMDFFLTITRPHDDFVRRRKSNKHVDLLFRLEWKLKICS